MNKPYFCRNFFLTDRRYKRLKNKIDLLLFYREHFYGFLENEEHYSGRHTEVKSQTGLGSLPV